MQFGKRLLERESSFHSKNLARERMYRGVDIMRQSAALSVLTAGGRGIAKLNALKAIVDTYVSRLSKDRPMPSIITDGEDWRKKQKARKYRQFVVGQMAETEFDGLSRRALFDGARIGSGFTRIDDNENATFAERIPVNDLLFDRRECKYGKPGQAIRIQRVAKDVLWELFPEARAEIDMAPPSLRRKDDVDVDSDGPHEGDLDDYVDTWEAWHPPITPDSESGLHVLCIDGKTLVSERWHEPRFPWAMFQLGEPDWGIYSDGMVDLLGDLQHRVNSIVRDIQLNLTATGRGHWMVNEANDVPVEMMSSWAPFKFKFKGSTPPVYNAPTPFNPAQMSALDKFIGFMFELSGVSQANATSKSALGAGASGVALDTQYDIDSDRFRMSQANYARYRLDAFQCYIDASARCARRRQESKGKKRNWVAVSWKDRDSIQKLEYDKVALDAGSYRLRIDPVNFIPDTRAGKLSIVEQLAKAGVIPQWLVPSLFDEPDLVQANNIMLAAFRNCMRKMDDIIDEDLPLPLPEQYNDLELELKIATAYYNNAQEERAPEEIQERFRQYVDLVVEAIGVKAPVGSPGMAGAAVPPGAPPMDPTMPMPPMPGGVPMMPSGPMPPPIPIGAQPMAA